MTAHHRIGGYVRWDDATKARLATLAAEHGNNNRAIAKAIGCSEDAIRKKRKELGL